MNRYFKIIIPIFTLLAAILIGGIWYVHYKLITNFLDKKSVPFSVLPIEYTFDEYEVIKNNPFNISVKISGLRFFSVYLRELCGEVYLLINA